MKKTLVKSILLAIFGMMVVQNVNAQKISAGEEVATNIGPGLKVNDYFYYDNILYQVVTPVANDNYEAKAVSFYGESLPAEIEILGGGQANNCTFTVTEIEALNSVKTMSGTSYVAGDASALSAITTIIFVKEDGFGGFAGTIDEGAFANLSGLQYVYTELTTVPEAEEGAFSDICYDALLFAPKLYVPVYANAEGWNEFFRIYALEEADASELHPFGDVDNDGEVGLSDIDALVDFMTFYDTEGYNEASLDIDGSGNGSDDWENIVDLADLDALIDYITFNGD